MKNKFPVDWIIIGAMKSGTTSLLHMIGQHPDIFALNEVQYYNKFYPNAGYYIDKFKDHQDKVCGEKSPSLMYNENFIKRMHDDNPDYKLIIILRNPIDRAYSHYQMNKENFNTNLSFPLCLDGNKSYIRYKSEYHIPIRMIRNYFPPNQLYITTYERFFDDATKNIQDIFDFLGVKKFNEVKEKKMVVGKHCTDEKVANEIAKLTSYRNKNYIYQSPAWLDTTKEINRLKKKCMKLGYEKLDAELRAALYNKYFKTDVKKLSNLLKVDFNKVWDC